MGMAASQARYLELTARKTDVEYAGQQINQQRTTLANESAGMFAKLMNLVVPTAPSSNDFTTTAYTFDDGANQNTVTGMQSLSGDPDYNKSVTYNYNQSVYTGIAKTRTDLGVNLVDATVTTTVTTTSTSTTTDTTTTGGTYWLTDGAAGGKAVNKTQLIECSTTSSTYATDKTALDEIVKDAGSGTNLATDYAADIGNVYKYSANGVTYYYSKTDLDVIVAAKPDGSAASSTGYYASNLDTKQTQTEKAYVTQDASGRYSTIKLASQSNTLSLTATTTTNEAAYNDAMNEYTYQTQLYQQQVNNINAKTETIEQQDKMLELQLTQLDTEQKALSTEMDSVKKVIDKNIEQTFKTFSS